MDVFSVYSGPHAYPRLKGGPTALLQGCLDTGVDINRVLPMTQGPVSERLIRPHSRISPMLDPMPILNVQQKTFEQLAFEDDCLEQIDPLPFP